MNFSAEKCELLKSNSIDNDGLLLNGDDIKGGVLAKFGDFGILEHFSI